jgi:hypothetical protein
VAVRVCQGLLLGEMYKNKLEAMGVPALLQYESAGPVFGITVDGLGAVKVMVPAELADEARELLADLSEEEMLASEGEEEAGG